MRIRCRPQTDFPSEFHARSQPNRFGAGWRETRRLLEHELDHLGAHEVVIELALGEGDLRLDGWPYADARTAHPGVVLSFDSRHGPLRYGTDAFPTWQANVRAIALGLEALRKVERYGIGKRGEQYVGWKALPAPGVDRGRTLIDEHGSLSAAIKATHPDHGGDRGDFEAVMAAKAAA